MSAEIIDPRIYAYGDPHPVFDKLRREDPVCWIKHDHYPPFWAITKYDDIRLVCKTPDVFHNAPETLWRSQAARLLERSVAGDDADFLEMSIGAYNAAHRRSRDSLQPSLGRSALTSWRPRIARIVHETLNEVLCRRTEGDFVTDVARTIPEASICQLLGIPRQERLRERVTLMMRGFSPSSTAPPSEVENGLQASDELYNLIRNTFTARRMLPQDDLITELAYSSGVNTKAATTILFFLATAAHWTVSTALSNGIIMLSRNADVWSQLRCQPELVRNAADEIVRLASPIIHVMRKATTDFELRGRKIKRGQMLALFYPSANRDEDIFDEPHEFRLDRKIHQHLSYGIGRHYCIGSGFAQILLETVLNELVRRCESIDVIGPAELLECNVMSGVLQLPVRYHIDRAFIPTQTIH